MFPPNFILVTHTTAREATIVAAERIVAEMGLRALTSNDVQQAAGQSNKSAVAYHFGLREGLVEATIAARMETVSRRRQGLLDELEHSAEPLTIRQAVRVLVEPLGGRDAQPSRELLRTVSRTGGTRPDAW